eukprot:Transcript_989.p3 GENE.Transcript_989~~Transcript_989.p3  ORF type:complete len:213 (-),score=96.11 Transcript_989:1709-2272(-)
MARGDKKAKEAAAASAGPRAPPPTAEVMQQLASTTHFTAPELQALVQRFAQLDTDGDGSVDAEAVCEMGEVAMYPLLRRVVSKYNEDKSGSLTFAEFCQALSTLSGKATLDEKLHFAFDLYDVNGNGAISPDEMFDVFRLMSPRHYTDDALQQIVNAFMAEYPQGLAYEDFSQMFSVSDLSKLTLNL